MKHPSAREVYDYWNAQRGPRAAPERSEIEPSAIRRALADTFILAYDAGTGAGHSFRVAGTRLCAAFGRELRGAAFIDLWDQESRHRMRDLLGVVARECVGIVAGAKGCGTEGAELDFELLVLPLRYRIPADARLLGVLAPRDVPYWFGMNPVGRLSLGTIRYLGEHDGRAADRRTEPLPPGGRIRHGLVVYDGGQG
jgi:hypothetical protein